MLHPSTRKLVERLYNLTAERRIAWSENSRGHGVYKAGAYEVEVSADPCEIRICRTAGHELESMGFSDLAEMQTEDGRSFDRIVRELAIDSVRIASGLETAISSLMATLDGDCAEDETPVQAPQDQDYARRIVDFAGATQKRSAKQKKQGDDSVDVLATDDVGAVEDGAGAERDYSTWT